MNKTNKEYETKNFNLYDFTDFPNFDFFFMQK